MVEKIKEKINAVKKAAGVEILLLPDNIVKIAYVVVLINKKNILVQSKGKIESDDLSALKKNISADTPVYLVLSGKGILHKKIKEPNDNDTALIHSILPNAKVQELYIQKDESENSTLVSIVRKDIVESYLKKIRELDLYCTGFSLGGTMVGTILSIVKETERVTNFSWSHHSLEISSSGGFSDYKFNITNSEQGFFTLDSEQLEASYLTSYAASLSVILNNDPYNSSLEEIKKRKEDFLMKRIFQKTTWAVLAFFLVALMLNFFLYTNFSAKNNELTLKEAKYRNMLSEMDKLDKEVKDKKYFLSEAGWLNISLASYFGDRIASTVPASVRLTELLVNPLDENKTKEIKKDVFSYGVIVIKGNCLRPTELNEWLDKIKKIDKVSKAKLVQYAYNDKEHKGTFSIEINTEL